jgi:uncharacterized protein (DUF983 family)
MHGWCAACGLRYEQAPGFFVGAIYVNYGLTVAVAGGAVLALDWTVGLTLAQELTIGVVLAALVPVAFFRYARSLWLSTTWWIAAGENRRTPASRRR